VLKLHTRRPWFHHLARWLWKTVTDDSVPRSSGAAENAASGSAPAPNSILADLAKERAQRQEQRQAPMAARTCKKKKNKPKGQKLVAKQKHHQRRMTILMTWMNSNFVNLGQAART
jgi:hypothetical protein